MRKLRWLSMAALLATVVLAGFIRGASADFVIRGVDARFLDDTLRITTDLDMSLSAKTEEALNKGIPLDVVIDYALVEHRRFLWDRVVTDRSLRRRVQYHALSGQYLVISVEPGADDFERFATAQAALAYIGTLNDLEIPLAKKKDISNQLRYSLRLRVSLDIESLPTLLRPLAYATPAWHHNSGWTTWAVER